METFWWLAIILLQLAASITSQGILDSVAGFTRNIVQTQFNSFPDTSKFLKEYDFVIVGAGAGGSVLANRLTEVDNWQVLLLEAGAEESIVTDVPLAAPYLSFTSFNWGYTTERQQGVCEGMQGKKCVWPRGKAVGGSTVINYMMYTRGNPKDFDRWAQMGNKGWSYEEVLPYFKKFEDVRIKEIRNSTIRGRGGELTITHAPWHTPIAANHLKAGVELGLKVKDINGEDQIGISLVQATMKNGRRLSAARAFLRPIRHRSNLHVVKNARVTRIVIDPQTKTALGVEFAKNRVSYSVRTKREIILSAGTLSSPQLLMLSGVGPRSHLEELGIPVIEDMPAVGENLQDHVMFAGLTYLVNQTVTLVDSRISLNPANGLNWLLQGSGPLTCPGGAEVYAFLNTRENLSDYPELPEDIPDIELIFSAGAIFGDTGGGLRKAFGISDDLFFDTYSSVLGKDGFGINQILLKPKSRGRLRLKSRNPFHWPLFYPNYYADKDDLKHMLRGIRWAQKFGRAKALQQYNPQLFSRPFKQCGHHPFDSDEYWICSAQLLSTNIHHQVGTCKMGPSEDPTAVVDPQLRVKGIKGLRVADASVIPEIPSGHTMAMTYVIGEKAADLIKTFWINTK